MNRTQRAKIRAEKNLLDTYKEEKEVALGKVKAGFSSAFITKGDYSSILKEKDKSLKKKKKAIKNYKIAMLSEPNTFKEVSVGA